MPDRSQQLDSILEQFALVGLSEEEQARVKAEGERIESDMDRVITMMRAAVADRGGKEALLREIARRANG
jgi:hypothetical protein